MKDVNFVRSWYKQLVFQIYKNNYNDYLFGAYIHYPNQFMLSAQTARYGLVKQKSKSDYIMSFSITMLEILSRRNKPKARCRNWNNFDQVVMEHNNIKFGCRAPYQTYVKHLPICSEKENIQKVRLDLLHKTHEAFIPPCETITHVSEKYEEIKGFYQSGEQFAVQVIFPNRLRVIRQSKEITFHSLVGNSGGYIGLFLGRYSY